MIGCNEQPKEAMVPGQKFKQKPLRLGLIPEVDIFSPKKRYTLLVKYLEGKLGVVIELKSLSRYGNTIDNFISEDLAGAFFGS